MKKNKRESILIPAYQVAEYGPERQKRIMDGIAKVISDEMGLGVNWTTDEPSRRIWIPFYWSRGQ